MRVHCTVFSWVVLGGIAAVADGATVNHDEAVSGDLPYGTRGAVPTLFAFDAGANSVRGTERFITGSVDLDGFRFTLGDAMRLESVIFEYSGTPQPLCQEFVLWVAPPGLGSANPGTALARASASLGSAGSCQVQIAPIVPSGSSVFGEALPLIGGIYEISDNGGQFSGATFDGLLNYRFTFNVAAVPGPATGWLLATGLAAVFGWRAQRRARTDRA
jgi:hypothetical protein